MNKISEIISKQIVSVFEAEKIGTIKNIALSNNFKKIKAFVFFDDECEFDSAVFAKNVFKATQDGVLIRNLSKVTYNYIDDQTNPINTSVFLLDGTSAGKICDVVFDEKFNVLKFKTTHGKSFLPNQILKMGFDACIVKNESVKTSIASFKPPADFVPQTPELENVQVRLVKLGPENFQQHEPNTQSVMPIKIKPDISTLVGKTASKTIKGLNNEIIVRENAIISKHTLEMAKVHNKTYELMFSSL